MLLKEIFKTNNLLYIEFSERHSLSSISSLKDSKMKSIKDPYISNWVYFLQQNHLKKVPVIGFDEISFTHLLSYVWL